MDDKRFLSNEMMVKNKEAEALKKVAFVGVALSTTAVLCAVLVVPMLYNHMQYVHSALQVEVDYCKSHSSTLRQELGRTRVLADLPVGDRRRLARQTQPDGQWGNQDSYGAPVVEKPDGQEAYRADTTQRPTPATDAPVTGAPQVQVGSCCTCQQGAAGAPGPVGAAGRDGQDGPSGQDGAPGSDGGFLTYNPCDGPPCFECEEALPGDRGAPGPQGAKGPVGDAGIDADGGIRGPDGPQGPTGQPGTPGQNGLPGGNGSDGVMRIADAPQGPPGMTGEPGSKGPSGPPGPAGLEADAGIRGEEGDAGDAGPDGTPGTAGLPGLKGEFGEVGACNHCPPPRTAPGY